MPRTTLPARMFEQIFEPAKVAGADTGNEPEGITNTTGIYEVSMGTNP